VMVKAKRPLKELLLAMPPVGEDADFERNPDRGRDVELRATPHKTKPWVQLCVS
jgi:hypothetical protein